MTQNEVDIIKNSVIDATEAYVEARLAVLDFVRTQIGVVIEEPTKGTDNKYRHKVRCNKTTNTNGIVYNNVLSVGNIPFPTNSVVFLIAPNAQYSNQFILGKLDDTPCNISAGSITLGSAIYLSSKQDTDGSYGHIADFKIFPNQLKFTGENNAVSYIMGTGFRISQFADTRYLITMCMDGNKSRIYVNTNADPNGGLISSNAIGWDSNENFVDPTTGDYIWIKPRAIKYSISSGGSGEIGAGGLNFLNNNQDNLNQLYVSVNDSRIKFSYNGHDVSLSW